VRAGRKGVPPSQCDGHGRNGRASGFPARATFPQQCRLKQAADFRAVFSRGRAFSSGNFTVRIRPNGQEIARLGTVVAKKLLPRAVDRNRVRRGMREVFRVRRCQLAGFDVVIRLRARAVPGAVLDRELAALLNEVTR
jgi:ribonuclease P protein component